MITAYLDMDGVLCDLDAGMKRYWDLHEWKVTCDDDRAVIEQRLREYTNMHRGFETQPQMPRFAELEFFVAATRKHIDWQILTSHGSFHATPEVVGKQKCEWLQRNSTVLSQLPFNLSETSHAKGVYAGHGRYLIDDSESSCESFNCNRGVAYRYVPEQLDSIIADLEQRMHAMKGTPWRRPGLHHEDKSN